MKRGFVAGMLLSILVPVFARSGPGGGKPYTLEEIRDEFRKHNYVISSGDIPFDRFPVVLLDVSFDATIDEKPEVILDVWLKGLKVTYQIHGHSIVLLPKYPKFNRKSSLFEDAVGVVVDADNQPVVGATVTNQRTRHDASTDAHGKFRMAMDSFSAPVLVSHIGFERQVNELSNTEEGRVVKLTKAISELDKAQVKAFGITSKRWDVSNRVEISEDEVANKHPARALDAAVVLVPGLYISDINGVAGSAQLVRLGGQHSILQNKQPLIVVNGVPLATDGFLNPIGSGSAQGPGGASNLNFISAEDIASITVLKDAAATAIYGSRASNGVILITLKTGRDGVGRPLRLAVDASYEVAKRVPISPLLSTAQFLQLRREGVINDGGTVGPQTVPEAYLQDGWDPSRHADYQKLATGGSAPAMNFGLQASGGTLGTYYYLSGQLHREGTGFPGSFDDDRRSFLVHFHSQLPDSQFQFNFTGMYSFEGNHLPQQDLTPFTLLAPTAPTPLNALGQQQWGVMPNNIVNIPAQENNDYRSDVYTLFGQLQGRLRLNGGFSIEENIGYNGILTSEKSVMRLSGQDSATHPSGSMTEAQNRYSHASTETIGRWGGSFNPLNVGVRFDLLAGVDYQVRETNYRSMLTTGYSSDQDLDMGINAQQYSPQNNNETYHYSAVFGGANIKVMNRYVGAVSWRRDGSSRLGHGDPAGDFASVGAGWIFSDEAFVPRNRWLSYGKVRLSYGTTGNEPIADQAVNQTYTGSNSARGYQNQQGTVPQTLANRYLHWERDFHEEMALELGFFHDQLLFTGAYSRSWTTNQLVKTSASPVTGLANVLANVSGIDVENRAFEFELSGHITDKRHFRYDSRFVLTIPRNRLVRWPGLANTIYFSRYVEGHPLSASPAFHSTGVDPKSGYYTFRTDNPNGEPGAADKSPSRGLDPIYYAGWDQSLTIGDWTLELVFDYRRQLGSNPLIALLQQNAPGSQGILQLSNGPAEWNHRWEKQGDVAQQQRATSGQDTVASNRASDFVKSDALSVNASYLRLRMASLSYNLPKCVRKKLGLEVCRIYVSGKNLWTATHFPVTDPETQDPTVLAPMRTFVAGVHVSF